MFGEIVDKRLGNNNAFRLQRKELHNNIRQRMHQQYLFQDVCLKLYYFTLEEEEKIISSKQLQYTHTKCIQTPDNNNCLPEAAREL